MLLSLVFLGLLCPFFFFDSRLATRNPKEHELAKTVEPPICSESVAGDPQTLIRLGACTSWFTRSKGPGISILLYIPPLKINMSPKNGTTSQKDISSSNHHFSGDMLVFGRVHTSLLYEDTSLYIYLSVKTFFISDVHIPHLVPVKS